MFKVLLVFAVCTLTVSQAFAQTSGLIKEVINNEEMQIYVYNVEEEIKDPNIATKQLDVELIIKNINPNARFFTPFFVRLIDDDGNEYKAGPLLGTILPVRIASNDILNGRFTFIMPTNSIPSLLVWDEPDASKVMVDLTETKEPADPVLESDWFLTSNKGKIVADGRSELLIHDELMSISPKVYAVDLSIKNTSNDVISYSPAFAFVKDEKGYLYPIDLQNIGALTNPLIDGELKPGESVRGMLLFSLPDDVNKVMLIYDEEIGKGSYFAIPEFTSVSVILLSSITVIILMRLCVKR
ncbi:MAG: DUF4352 domain-containing protein [Nitrososphaerales archaeon]